MLLHAPTRKRMPVFGAVRPQDGHLVVDQASCFNADSFQSFLQHLLRHRRERRRQVVILDNARYHHARSLHPWLHAHRDVLCLHFLPPYSPEFNHQERVWKLTCHLVTHNRYFPNLDELVQAVMHQFSLWDAPNAALHRLCAII